MTTAAESRPVKQRKPKACKTCKSPFQPRSSTHVCCSIRCSVDFARVKREQKERKELAAAKERIKPRAQWLREAQAAVNRYVRLRDTAAGLPCISCGRHHQGQNHAGHYRSVGSAPHLRFDTERNMHLQCAPCNTHLHGNLVNYRRALIAKIGIDAVEGLEADQAPKHYSIDDLKQIKVEYARKRRELEKENK